ncbi:hypothetical protein NL108_017246 [Boleophthalmus pectinirostris]|nr:hypothetical protein NL108_017246 [Boleophthalmus pectinirostris]
MMDTRLLLLRIWWILILSHWTFALTEAGLKQVCFSGSDSPCLRIYNAENDQLLYDGASSSSPPPSCTSAPVGSKTSAPVNETCQVCEEEGKVLVWCWLFNPETRLDFDGNGTHPNFTNTSCPGAASVSQVSLMFLLDKPLTFYLTSVSRSFSFFFSFFFFSLFSELRCWFGTLGGTPGRAPAPDWFWSLVVQDAPQISPRQCSDLTPSDPI